MADVHNIYHVWPGGDEWLIVGKGPSFSKEKIEANYDKKIMCINESSNIVKADISIFNDLSVFKLFNEFSIENTKLFACPSSLRIEPKGSMMYTHNWLSVAETLLKVRDKIAYFDTNFSSRRMYMELPMLHAHMSTYETAIWCLGYVGVKKVYTIGVDFSVEHHADFTPRDSAVPFTASRYYAQVAIDFFKMNVTAI